jgi:hypothetical protein
MFMDEGKTPGPLPSKSIIKEVVEVKEVKEVKEATQGKLLGRGGAEKVCYDANRRTLLCSREKRRWPPA